MKEQAAAGAGLLPSQSHAPHSLEGRGALASPSAQLSISSLIGRFEWWGSEERNEVGDGVREGNWTTLPPTLIDLAPHLGGGH